MPTKYLIIFMNVKVEKKRFIKKSTVTPISGGIIYVRTTFNSIPAMQNQPVIPNGKFECPIQVVHVIYGLGLGYGLF